MADGRPNKAYREGWAALSWLMDRGTSWSGHERNCVYLNRGNGQFVDVSGLSGLDFPDDGRGVVSCDWDGDGDLDLWLRSRSAPSLRFMENTTPTNEQMISVRLRATKGNRDAIGARVTLHAEGGSVTRIVGAGSGYLSQSTTEVLLRCPGSGKIVDLSVQWENGRVEEARKVAVGSRLLWVEGRPPETREQKLRQLPAGAGELQQPAKQTSSGLVFLRTPLVAPPSLLTSLFGGNLPTRPTFCAVWAQWCGECKGEVADLFAANEQLRAAELDVLLLNADTVKQRRAAFAYLKTLPGVVEGSGALKHRFLPSKLSAVIQAVARHVLGSNEEIPLPLGLLIDTKGMIQIMTVGRVGADLLMDGHTQVQKLTTNPARRSLSGGQYYFLMPRDLNQLASLLDGVDATFYRRLASQQQK